MKHDLSVMLIGQEKEAFDDEDWIFELKMDGIRVLAYIEDHQVDLRNKRNLKLIQRFPEMKDLGKYVRKDCILDGELYCYDQGQIDFSKIQRRVLLRDPFKIRMQSHQTPAVFTAFDILYYGSDYVMDRPLMERKKILEKCIRQETAHFSRSRYIFEEGCFLYEKTKEKELEGIVAKKKDSLYKPGERTKQWIKIKYLKDDDFAVVGYKVKESGSISLILAQYDQGKRIYIGQVMTSLSRLPKHQVKKTAVFDISDAIWLKDELCAKVKFMEKTASGSLRQPVLIDFVYDKRAEDCQM